MKKLSFTFVITETPEANILDQEVYPLRKSFVLSLEQDHHSYGAGYVFLDGCRLSKLDVKVMEKEPKRRNAAGQPVDNFVCFNERGIIGYSQDALLTRTKQKGADMLKIGPAQGTRADHLYQFMKGVVRLLAESNAGQLIFMMEEWPMYKDHRFVNTIYKAGHKIVYLPPNTASFNPSRFF